MKVCVIQYFSLSDHLAISSALIELIDVLTMSGHEVSAIVVQGKKADNKKMIMHPELVTFYEVKMNAYSVLDNLLFLAKNKKKLQTVIRNADLVIARYPFSSLLTLWPLQRRVKVIYDIRSLWIEMLLEKSKPLKFFSSLVKPALYRVEIYLINKLVDGLIFLNHHTSSSYVSHGLEVKDFPVVHTLAGATDSAFFRRRSSRILHDQFDFSDQDFLVGYIGSLQKMREIEFFIEAFHQYRDRMPNTTKLVIIGEGNGSARLQRLVKKYNLSGTVFFSPAFNRSLVPGILSELSVGLSHLPNKLVFNCSSPMKIFEYAYCEVPILASDSPAHRQFKKYLPTLFFYTNQASFAENLTNIHTHYIDIMKQVKPSRSMLDQRFNNGILAEQVNRLLAAALKQ